MTFTIYIVVFLLLFFLSAVVNETWENVTGDSLCKPGYKADMYSGFFMAALLWLPVLMTAAAFGFFYGIWGIGKLISIGLAKQIRKYLDKREKSAIIKG